MDTPVPIISILTSIIMVTHLAETRSIRMKFKATARRMQKDLLTVAPTASVPFIEPPPDHADGHE